VKSKPRSRCKTESRSPRGGRRSAGGGAPLPAFELTVRLEGEKLPVPKKLLAALTSRAFRLTGREPGDVSLVVAGDGFIAWLNERYLGERGPTDVLSFPLREEAFTEEPRRSGRQGSRPKGRGQAQVPGRGAGPLGDIVISVETAERQAGNGGKALAEEFRLLYLHGLLHLLGYTHDRTADRTAMDGMLHEILKGGHAER
jgi:rRNA maturation RNase YbeY